MTEADLEDARRNIVQAGLPFTLELAWVTSKGDEDFGSFLNDPRLTPWGEKVQKRRPNPNAPRALFVGSNTSWLFYQSDGRPDLDMILMQHGLVWTNLTPASQAPTFWTRFFGRSDFFCEESDIPTLIITTGEIRTNGIGGGLTHTGYGPHLQEVAKSWGIHFAQLELPSSRRA
jgi:hypothetical protein